MKVFTTVFQLNNRGNKAAVRRRRGLVKGGGVVFEDGGELYVPAPPLHQRRGRGG